MEYGNKDRFLRRGRAENVLHNEKSTGAEVLVQHCLCCGRRCDNTSPIKFATSHFALSHMSATRGSDAARGSGMIAEKLEMVHTLLPGNGTRREASS